MAKASMTSKGQITVPADIRRQMNLELQDKVEFTTLPNGTTVMRTKKRDIRKLAGSVKPSTKKRVKVDDMRLE